jgi:hypothetical protein
MNDRSITNPATGTDNAISSAAANGNRSVFPDEGEHLATSANSEEPGAVTQIPSATVALASVVTKTPAAGELVNAGSAVNLRVSSGSTAALERTQKSIEAMQKKTPANIHDTIAIVVCAFFALAVMICTGYWKLENLKFDPDLYKNLPNVLSTLLVVSLFVERAIEVFVSAWSDPEADRHEQNRDYWTSRKAEIKSDLAVLLSELNGTPPPNPDRQATIVDLLRVKRAAIEEAAQNVDVESKALLPFEARTRSISTWIGLAIGIFVSAAGFRFLGQIVSVDAKNSQYSFFLAADVLLTGAVLAGGSKLIHQIFSVYDSFMNATQDSAAKKGASGR